jgi:hypothetical protein
MFFIKLEPMLSIWKKVDNLQFIKNGEGIQEQKLSYGHGVVITISIHSLEGSRHATQRDGMRWISFALSSNPQLVGYSRQSILHARRSPCYSPSHDSIWTLWMRAVVPP